MVLLVIGESNIFVRGRIQIFIISANYIWKCIEHYQGNYNGPYFI